MDGPIQINFDAPAVLRKWRSLKNERISNSLGANPYLIAESTLDECIREIAQTGVRDPAQISALAIKEIGIP